MHQAWRNAQSEGSRLAGPWAARMTNKTCWGNEDSVLRSFFCWSMMLGKPILYAPWWCWNNVKQPQTLRHCSCLPPRAHSNILKLWTWTTRTCIVVATGCLRASREWILELDKGDALGSLPTCYNMFKTFQNDTSWVPKAMKRYKTNSKDTYL